MRILGIESTAHTFGAGVYDSASDAILSNVKAFYKPVKEGIVPRKAADHHGEHAARVIGEAMKTSGTAFEQLGAIAYSAGPGLGPCLQTGAGAAAFLAMKYGKPLVPVNHCHAHVEVARWQLKMKDPIAIYVSGGNTQIIVGTKHPSFFGPPFFVLGETLDIGVGNLFDSFARQLGERWAHGSVVAKKAEAGRNYIELPYTVKGMNFAFSGLLTAAGKKIGMAGVNENDLCFSLLETAFAEICEAGERALLLSGKKEVVVCGGVAQNTHLVHLVAQMAALHGARAGTCESQYNADNGAMIALAGARQLEREAFRRPEARRASRQLSRGRTLDPGKIWIEQKWRIDQME